jgi:PAS domain S-box-containing protein
MSRSIGVHILLVEDDPGMALLATDRLTEAEEWQVTTAQSAADCRAHVATQPFDVILLDRGLPDCDGATLIGELLTALPDVAIVMLSAADSAASATETLKLGACDYLAKTPDLKHLDELPTVIRRSLERIRWKREEARLRNEMDLLLTAIRSTGDAVIMTDCQRTVQFWNIAAEKLFGWRAEEVLGKPIPFIPPDRETESNELSQRASRGDPLVGIDTVRQRRDGSLVEVSLTLTAAVHDDGSVRAYVAVVRDISERKAIEQARADFVAMLTHDIKNPLAVIRDCAEILAEAKLTADDADWVCTIHHASDTIERLVTDFLMTAAIEAGSLTHVQERIPVAGLVSASVDQFRTAAARRLIRLEAEETADAAFVNGDRMQIERALGNLINNAIKFTPAGGSVSVGAVRRNGNVEFQVRDTGPGISADELAYVFDKYRRVRGTEQIDGSGLGLYIVRHLIQAHGGSVAVSSEVGRGSVFTISLPVSAAGAALEPAQRTDSAASIAGQAP